MHAHLLDRQGIQELEELMSAFLKVLPVIDPVQSLEWLQEGGNFNDFHDLIKCLEVVSYARVADLQEL